MSDLKEATIKSDVPQFVDLDNQLLVEAFGYSSIPAICLACQNLHKPSGQHFQCLANQDGDRVTIEFAASAPETPLANICSGFRSCLPTNIVYDPSGNRRRGTNTLSDHANFHAPPPGAS